ncbi:hypothetical protein HMPREF0693_1483 [Proteus mirabilis ATCC 29906]|nr:hypothetical protein HMPREF0693_1483 [Proteus mirabilis ATCC 29906]KXB99393.1 hypothetical protein HMPREF3203_02966 [Proteus mirabilis]PVF83856.1 hypothetical protein CSC14_3297 [Proteus mirabilis]
MYFLSYHDVASIKKNLTLLIYWIKSDIVDLREQTWLSYGRN